MPRRKNDQSRDWRGKGFLINAAYWSGIIPLAILILVPAAFWPLIEHFALGVPESLGGAALKQMAWLAFAFIAATAAFTVVAAVWIGGQILSWLVKVLK